MLSSVATAPLPSSELLSAVLAEPALGSLVSSAVSSVDARLGIEGPAALRPLVVGALARATDQVPTTLAVCATERESEELAATLTQLVGADAVEVLPSWETLPHERLSPEIGRASCRERV